MRRALPALALAAALAACGAGVPQGVVEGDTPTPEVLASDSDPWDAPRASTFAQVVRPPVPAFTNAQLHRNFLSIALRAEAAGNFGRNSEIGLAKWTGPIRYALLGARPDDVSRVVAEVRRLRRLTGLDIAPAINVGSANMVVRFVPFRQRAHALSSLGGPRALGSSVAALVARWRDTETEKCLSLIGTDRRSGAIDRSQIFIKDELPVGLRNACIVEEIVQSLGLMNDDPRANPSIFNDDQRYLELTEHDAYLLRVLYDPRLRPGMDRRQAGPLAREIIRGLRADPWPVPAGERVRDGGTT